MIEALAFSTTVCCVLAGLVVLVAAAAGRYRSRAVLPVLVLVELALLVQAVADVLALTRGHQLAEPTTHLAYLATSLVILPATVTQNRDDGRWTGVLVAVALVALAVVVVRMQTTWRVTAL